MEKKSLFLGVYYNEDEIISEEGLAGLRKIMNGLARMVFYHLGNVAEEKDISFNEYLESLSKVRDYTYQFDSDIAMDMMIQISALISPDTKVVLEEIVQSDEFATEIFLYNMSEYVDHFYSMDEDDEDFENEEECKVSPQEILTKCLNEAFREYAEMTGQVIN